MKMRSNASLNCALITFQMQNIANKGAIKPAIIQKIYHLWCFSTPVEKSLDSALLRLVPFRHFSITIQFPLTVGSRRCHTLICE